MTCLGLHCELCGNVAQDTPPHTMTVVRSSCRWQKVSGIAIIWQIGVWSSQWWRDVSCISCWRWVCWPSCWLRRRCTCTRHTELVYSSCHATWLPYRRDASNPRRAKYYNALSVYIIYSLSRTRCHGWVQPCVEFTYRRLGERRSFGASLWTQMPPQEYTMVLITWVLWSQP